MNWVDLVKQAIPDYAKDTRLNIDAVILRSSIPIEVAVGCALAAAVATGNGKLVSMIYSEAGEFADPAMTAASLMAQNNVWYPYVEMAEDEQLAGLPAQLRMNAIATNGGTTKDNFEVFSLAASIVGKCHFCVKAHYNTLKKHGWSVEQLRDVGRIASVINSVAKVLNS